ncbi:MAG: cardiolipin synthase, partial [Alistipes sp.]|nr:cardiolipin synthase [Alistipes sp.]
VPYTDGGAKMEALLEAIGRARHHIHVQYYILADDATGRRLRDALVARAREGVEVRVLYDDVGSVSTRRAFFDAIRREGIECRAVLHVQFPRFTSKVNYRNHRKVVVVDGRVAFFGGMNVADRYVEGVAWGVWRDIHFRVEGGAVAGLQAAFLSDWSATTRCRVGGAAYYPPIEPLGDNLLQLVAGGPFGKWRALQQAESFALTRARRRIWIQTPYYLPSEVLNTALQSAALAGIDVRLMLPERSDSRVVDLASHSYLDDMMKAGVKILLFRAGFLHSKLLVVDDDLAIVGSANMDFRSFEHNFEINAFVYDAAFASRMAELFERDAASCRRLSPGEWFRRPRYLRFAESVMRIFSPLL